MAFIRYVRTSYKVYRPLFPMANFDTCSNKSVLLLLVATVKVESKQWPGTVKVAVRGGLKRSVWAMLTL